MPGEDHLTTVAIPGGPSRTSIATATRIPGTSEALAGGFTHAAGNAGLDDAGVLLEYENWRRPRAGAPGTARRFPVRAPSSFGQKEFILRP